MDRFVQAPPPPSSMTDIPRPPLQAPPPPPPPATWYPNQFQYQAPPPHPNQSLWTSNPADHQQSYPTPHQNTHIPPYPAHPPPQPPNHYYTPPPHQYPSYSHSQPPQVYPQSNTHQTWGSSNWPHHQVWEHSDRTNPNNNEDWAAKAKAWAAGQSAMENQHSSSQFAHIGRPEENNHSFQDQYHRTVDPHYGSFQQPSLSASSHHQFPVSMGDFHRMPTNHQHESSSFSSGPSSYYPSDLHESYASSGGALGADPNPAYPHQGNISVNSSGFQQEVPSSYSSFPGKGEVEGQDVQLHTSPSFPMPGQETQHHVQPALSTSARSVSEERPYFTYAAGSAGPVTDPSDRPLEFAPGFNRNHESHDQHPHSGYMLPDPAGPVGYGDHVSAPSISALTTPVVPGMSYPPSGGQFDPSFVSPMAMFGQIPGPNFRPNIPTGGAAFGLGAGTVLHGTSTFPGDPNGLTSVSDRPKKAPLPNWLREEISKTKASMTSSSQERLEEDPDNHTEIDNIEKSFVKRGHPDRQSFDSARSSDDEDNVEDDIEAARTAAINQEIKRVLTEVLLKVTDELFDEIATKVLDEDTIGVEVDHNNAPQNQKLPPSPPAVPVPKASAKVLIPVKPKETNKSDDASGKSPLSAGDLLGLGSYASDDDDYDETESSSKSTKGRVDAPLPESIKLSEDIHEAVENGGSQVVTKGHDGIIGDNDHDNTRITEASSDSTTMDEELRGNELDKNSNHEKDRVSIFHEGGGVLQGTVIADGENMVEQTDDLKSKDTVGGKNSTKADVGPNSLTYVSQASQARSKPEKNQELESKRILSSKGFVKETGGDNLKVGSKHSGSGESRRDERNSRKEKPDERNGTKERVKDRSTKSGDKARESDPRRKSHSKDDKTENEKSRESDSRRSSYSKDDKTENENVEKDSTRDDHGRKRSQEKDVKEDGLRHHNGRDSSSHKRRHSPSVGSRVRNSKEHSVGSHAKESSDESFEDSRRRKKHSRKRSLSASPTRSSRRQVSPSPHSRHSHRRQSPYSSLDNRRGRRSRSNSPVRRRR